MNWQAFSQVMYGISDLCFAAYDRLQKAEQRQAPLFSEAQAPRARSGGYDFRRHMLALGETNGVRLVKMHDRRTTFMCRYEGQEYVVSTVLASGMISLGLFSAVHFPHHSIPLEVLRAIKKQNAKTPQYTFDLLEMEDHSLFFIQTIASPDSLTSWMFQSVLVEMAERMAILDSSLVENGFAA